MMSESRKAELRKNLASMVQGMHWATDVLISEAMERGIIYTIHGDQMPSTSHDLYKANQQSADEYYRTFDQNRATLDELALIISAEDGGAGKPLPENFIG